MSYINFQDLEFLVTNKVTHIVNCAGKQIPNNWESIGVSYLTLNWLETDNQVDPILSYFQNEKILFFISIS
jgi:hypothetical protein